MTDVPLDGPDSWSDEAEPDDDELDNDELAAVTEPPAATRSSPYAVASFVLAVVAFSQVPSQTLFFGDDWVRIVLMVLPTSGVAVLARWLATRAEEDVYVSDGRLGGVGLYRAAKVLSVLVLVWVGLTLLAHAIDTRAFGLNFDV